MSDTIRPSEVDLVNEKVAAATGLSLKFLYQTDKGREPSARSLKMDLEAITRLQRENDNRPISTTVMCCTCKHTHEDPVIPQRHSISQKMAMSDAWSRELRRKIQESKRKEEVRVYVDPYFEDWE